MTSVSWLSGMGGILRRMVGILWLASCGCHLASVLLYPEEEERERQRQREREREGEGGSRGGSWTPKTKRLSPRPGGLNPNRFRH